MLRVLLPLAAGLCALAACKTTTPPVTPARYNVLFISLDTVRQDVLGIYGHHPRHAPELSTTPNLDRFAHEGVRMADAYASSSWTLPSHLSMMTGLPALAHGVETESGVLDPGIPTMAEILSNHGYRTVGIYSAPFLDPHWGFGRGFDTYTPVYGDEEIAAAERVAKLRHESEQAAAAADWPRYDDAKRRQTDAELELDDDSQIVVTSDQVVAATVAEIETHAKDGQPWLVFSHFFDAHCDYVPPPPYDTRFDPHYEGTFTGKNCMGGGAVGSPDPDRPGALIRALGDRDLEHAFALYEGEVAWVDEHVGQLLKALERSGQAANTLVVIVSDHGEEFFEHGGLGHRRTLREEVVRIPMLLRLPGVLPADRTVLGAVSVSDLLPTILAILGLPHEAQPGSASFLAAMTNGGTVDQTPILRTIMMFAGQVHLDGRRDDKDAITVRQVMVHDGFRHGAIKIARRRSWPQFEAGLAPEVTTILNREAAAQYQQEVLQWWDVARSPGEPEESASTDFTDAAAHAGLVAFQRAYAAALARRPATHDSSALPHNIRTKLESLGYLERATGPTFPEPDLVLPVPGAGLIPPEL